MPQKKEELPMNVDVDLQNGGTITYANEVIAIIAGVAANEVEGIAGMCVSNGFGDIIGRNRNVTRGVKVEIGSEEASVDLYIIVEYGQPIQKVSREVQENVRKAIESMTGLHVVRVDVHVQGVSFEKEKKEMQSSLAAASKPVLTAPEAPAREEKKPEPAPAVSQKAEAAAAPDTQDKKDGAAMEEKIQATLDAELADEGVTTDEEALADEQAYADEETLAEQDALDTDGEKQ
mgnify:CR=1 FL=1